MKVDFPDEPTFHSGEMTTVSFWGKVVDENDNAVSSATVKLLSGNEIIEKQTDRFGLFRFDHVANSGNQVFISISAHQSYFDAYRLFPVLEDKIGYTEIKLRKKEYLGTVNAQIGGELTHDPSGAKVELPAGGFIDESGENYGGEVDVVINWINPDSEDLSREIIGDLSGVNDEGDVQALTTLESVAPSSIPLWSFNEEIGKWIEEGEAIKQNGFYVGKVSHFSSWNVDVKSDPIDIIGQVYEEIGGELVPASYYNIYVSGENVSRTGGWLCEAGDFLFYNFPRGEEFELVVKDDCGDEVHRSAWGPYDSDINIGDIIINEKRNSIRVYGSAEDCMNNSLNGGRIEIYSETGFELHSIDPSGCFDFSFDPCANETEYIVIFTSLDGATKAIIEVDDNQESWEFTPTLCDSTNQLAEITLTIDSADQYILPNIQFEFLSNGDLAFYSVKRADSTQLETVLLFPSPESSSSRSFQIMFTGYQGIPETKTKGYILSSQFETELSRYDPFREIAGSFEGIFQETSSPTPGVECDVVGSCEEHYVTGTFKVDLLN